MNVQYIRIKKEIWILPTVLCLLGDSVKRILFFPICLFNSSTDVLSNRTIEEIFAQDMNNIQVFSIIIKAL